MISDTSRGVGRILGSLRAVDGAGAVRMEDRFDTDIQDLWSALTDPARLARWLGEVTGELRLGGEFSAQFFASGWNGAGWVQECQPPNRLLVRTVESGQSDEEFIEATLTADGDQTILVIEERGMPLDQLAAYGAGVQVHVEDLAAYLAGHEPCDAQNRWEELLPTYQDFASSVGHPLG
jgi:uncharacterized protein YndB with AHSA1/START domain